MAKHRAAAVRRKIRETSIPLLLMTVVNSAISAGLLVQPARFTATPAYGVLLDILNQRTWGFAFMAVSIVMVAALLFDNQSRPLTVIAHIMAISLATIWLVGFIVRYLSDPSTTIVNVLSWSLHIAVLGYSLSIIDRNMLSQRSLGPLS